MDIFTVVIGKKANRDLQTVLEYIARKVGSWIDAVAHDGLSVVRRVPDLHDEPLKGDRLGLRSIRLSKAYRAVYTIGKHDHLEIAKL